MKTISVSVSEVEMEHVVSSQVSSIGYLDGYLYVQFMSRSSEEGPVYAYQGVPEDLFQQARVADSVGRFLNGHIFNVYETYKIPASWVVHKDE